MKKNYFSLLLSSVVFCLISFLPNHSIGQTIWNSGSKTFVKTAVGQIDTIAANTHLTRGNSLQIFNIKTEAGGIKNNCTWTPGNTQWAYGDIADWNTLSYQNLFVLNSCSPPSMVDQPMVLHLIAEDIYLQITFTFWQAAGGNFTYTRTTTSFNCNTTSTTNATICTGSNYSFNGTNYNSSGTYTATLTNAGGCDSVATLNLTVASLSSITGATSLCVGNTNQLNNTETGGTWQSMNNKASINSSGLVTATNSGTAVIRYSKNVGACTVYSSTTFVVGKNTLQPSIAYAPGTINPQRGNSGGFCPNKTFTVVGTPSGGTWSSTGVITVHPTTGVVNTGAVAGAATLTYTFNNASNCSNSKTISALINSGCFARGIANTDEILKNDNNFTMYPNPAKSVVSLQVDKLIGAGSIVITDLYGKQIKMQPLSMGNNLLNIANLTKGMYFISVITSEGKTTKKLIVE